MGAIAISNRAPGSSVGREKVVEADVAFSSSYATGGDTIDPRQLGLRAINQVTIPSHHIRTGKPVEAARLQSGLSVSLGGTPTAPTLLAYDSANTQVAAATNLSARTLRLRFLGYQSHNGVGDGEVGPSQRIPTALCRVCPEHPAISLRDRKGMTLMTHRNYQPGVLANSVGKQLHPQSHQVSTGGMTYKPNQGASEAVGSPTPDVVGSTPAPGAVREAEVAGEAHNLAAEGSIPSPATPVCAELTKAGEPCRAYPGEDGICTGHRNAKLAREHAERTDGS